MRKRGRGIMCRRLARMVVECWRRFWGIRWKRSRCCMRRGSCGDSAGEGQKKPLRHKARREIKMGEILVAGITHYPPLAGRDETLAWVLKRMLAKPKPPGE